jgi:hypothetical protein
MVPLNRHGIFLNKLKRKFLLCIIIIICCVLSFALGVSPDVVKYMLELIPYLALVKVLL